MNNENSYYYYHTRQPRRHNLDRQIDTTLQNLNRDDSSYNFCGFLDGLFGSSSSANTLTPSQSALLNKHHQNQSQKLSQASKGLAKSKTTYKEVEFAVIKCKDKGGQGISVKSEFKQSNIMMKSSAFTTEASSTLKNTRFAQSSIHQQYQQQQPVYRLPPEELSKLVQSRAIRRHY